MSGPTSRKQGGLRRGVQQAEHDPPHEWPLRKMPRRSTLLRCCKCDSKRMKQSKQGIKHSPDGTALLAQLLEG
eukprot:6435952-Alexandrium_andersonii.AAC.1